MSETSSCLGPARGQKFISVFVPLAALAVFLLTLCVICTRLHSFLDADMVSSLMQAGEILRHHTLFPDGWHGSTGIEARVFPQLLTLSFASSQLAAFVWSSFIIAAVVLGSVLYFGRFGRGRSVTAFVVMMYFTCFSEIQVDMFHAAAYYFVLALIFFLTLGVWLQSVRMDFSGSFRVENRVSFVAFWLVLLASVLIGGMRIVQQFVLPMAAAIAGMYFWEHRGRCVAWADIAKLAVCGFLFVLVAGCGEAVYSRCVAPAFGIKEGTTIDGIAMLADSYDRVLVNWNSYLKGLLLASGFPPGASLFSVKGLAGLARMGMSGLFCLVFPALALLDYRRLPFAERFLLVFSWLGFAGLSALVIFGTSCPDANAAFVADARYILPAMLTNMVVGVLYFHRTFVRPGDAFAVLASVGLALFCICSNLAAVRPHLVCPSKETLKAEWSPVGNTMRLADFLKDQGLSYGYGSYWNASTMTLLTDGEVSIRPVIVREGHLSRWDWLSFEGWCDPAAHEGRSFVMLTPPEAGAFAPKGYDKTLFGPPEKVLERDGYVILVYDYNVAGNGFQGRKK